MRSLGRLVRGLSALFWGLPLALVVSVQTGYTHVWAAFGLAPPILVNALVVFAIREIGHFQPGERIWCRAVDRCRLLALMNLGLSPFLLWWRRMPEVLHYQFSVLVMAVSGLALLFAVNQMLERLAAMLPDETLRMEARFITPLNQGLVAAVLLLGALWVGLRVLTLVPWPLLPLLVIASQGGWIILLMLVLLPLALTMALIWKVKETILASVFATGTSRQ